MLLKKTTFFLVILFYVSVINAQNLIINGDFENDLYEWTTISDNGGNAIFQSERNGSYNSTKFLNVKVRDHGANLWDVQTYQQFPSKKGVFYTLSFLAKSSVNHKKLRVQLQKTSYTPVDFTLTTNWKEYTYQFQAKENDLQLGFHFIDLGAFRIDDIVITKSKKPKKEQEGILTNGSFENGMDGWLNLAENGGEASYNLNSNKPYIGSYSLQVHIKNLGKNPWDLQSIHDFPSNKNKTYILTFFAKSQEENSKVIVQIQKNKESIYIPKEFTLTRFWKRYQWIFKASADDMQLAFQHLDRGVFDYDQVNISRYRVKK